jgi:hypothetical protein
MSYSNVHSKDLSRLLIKLGNREVNKARKENHHVGIA